MPKISNHKRTVHNSSLIAHGFTIIEVLIVLAVIIAMVIVLIVAISPGDKLAQTRDTSRKNTVRQLGTALEAYALTNNDIYLDAFYQAGAVCGGVGGNPNWLECLVNEKELSAIPDEVVNRSGLSCDVDSPFPTIQNVNEWCYRTELGYANATIYARLESRTEINKCQNEEEAYFGYSTLQKRAGLICILNDNERPDINPTFTD